MVVGEGPGLCSGNDVVKAFQVRFWWTSAKRDQSSVQEEWDLEHSFRAE